MTDIQRVLVEHQDIDAFPVHGGRVCSCGNWSGPWTGYDFAGHIEEQLRPLILAAKAAAWDEGAQAEADAVGLTDEDEAAGEHEATFVCPSLNPYRSQP